MTYFLDTNICIYYLNHSVPNVKQMLEKISVKSVKIPSMVAAELLYGMEKSARREHNLRIIKLFLSLYEIMPFDQRAAEIYAVIRAEMERAGVVIGGNDLVIAATALAHGGTIVTHNVTEFSRVDGLVVEDWAGERT